MKVRPYKHGQRVRHTTLGDGTFLCHIRLPGGTYGYRINFDGALGIKELIAEFVHGGGRLRKIKMKPKEDVMKVPNFIYLTYISKQDGAMVFDRNSHGSKYKYVLAKPRNRRKKGGRK